jgi:hypothetical protein
LPKKFLEKLDTKKHILLVYDDADRAQKIEFEFIKIGLLNEEYCVFLVDHYSQIKLVKNKMNQNGIDVTHYENKNQLSICQIPQIEKDPDGIWAGFKKFGEKILSESTFQYRIVGRIISNVSNEVGMNVQIVIEKNVHAVFEELNASIMCHYDVREIPEKNCTDTINKLCCFHHTVIDIRDNKETVSHLSNIL